MDEQVLRVKGLFEEVVQGFGVMHAKVYISLLNGEIKTAKQLSEETGISYNKIYSVLNDLVKEKIVACTNSDPKNYRLVNPEKTFEALVNRKVGLLEKRSKEFSKAISSESEEGTEREYVIKFNERQTKLIDNKNKAIVRELREAKQVIKQLNIYIEKLEPRKEYNFALYR